MMDNDDFLHGLLLGEIINEEQVVDISGRSAPSTSHYEGIFMSRSVLSTVLLLWSNPPSDLMPRDSSVATRKSMQVTVRP